MTSLGPSWECPGAWSLLTEADIMILMQGLWLTSRLVTPARSWPICPTLGELHRKGLCLCLLLPDQASGCSWGYGRCCNMVYTSAYRPADSGRTIVTLESHGYLEPGCLDHCSLTTMYPLTKELFTVQTIWPTSLISCPYTSVRLFGY